MALTPTRYVYQRRGQPLLSWQNGIPPYQSRAATLRTLGSLGDDDTFGIQRPLLPQPGAPEYLDDPPDTLGEWGLIPSSSPPIMQRGFGGVPTSAPKKKGCGCGCKGKKMKAGKCAGGKPMAEYVATGEYVGMGDDDPTAASGTTAAGSSSLPIDSTSTTLPTPAPTVTPTIATSTGPTMSVSVNFGWFKQHPVATLAGAYVAWRLFFKK